VICSVDILNRFELRSQYAGDTIERSTDSSDQLGDDDIVLKMALSSDPKLAKLWKKAEQAGFTSESLSCQCVIIAVPVIVITCS